MRELSDVDRGSPVIRVAENESLIVKFQELTQLAAPDLSAWATDLAQSHAEFYRILFEYVNRICESGTACTALDVGAVPGFVTTTLKESGFDIQAVDLDPSRAERVFDSVNITHHKVDVEAEPLPFADGSMDLILFNEVLEHLRVNPIRPLREIFRVLRPGGSLLLSTPNITLSMRIHFVRGKDYQDDIIDEFAKLETLGHMGHFRLYSRKEVLRLLEHVGFKIERHAAHETIPRDRITWKRRLLRALAPEQLGDHLFVWAKK